MISLSREWIEISNARTGKKFAKKLSNLLKQNNVKNVLECGCGGGYLLYELSKQEFNCIGIDSSKEMINYAKQNYFHKNLKYMQLNWGNLNKLNKKFDAIICRGNSLVVGTSWEKPLEEFDVDKARNFIYRSVSLMFNSLKIGGLLYLDIISQKEIDNNGGNIELKTANIDLKGKIKYDWKNRIRYIFGSGFVNGNYFRGNSVSYLMTPKELEKIVKSFNPKKVWAPKFKHEKDYDIICAIK